MSKLAPFALALLTLLALPTYAAVEVPAGDWWEASHQSPTTSTIIEKTIVINSQGETCGNISGVFRVYLTGRDGLEYECRWHTRCFCTNNVTVASPLADGPEYTMEWFLAGTKHVVSAIYPG